MTDLKTLHDQDFVAWAKQQAEALTAAARSGSNQALDWENLAEEIEDLAAARKSALHSQLRRIIQHLLKLQYSEAMDLRRGWRTSIADARVEIDYILDESPSLKRELTRAIESETRRAIRAVVGDLEDYGELDSGGAAKLRATTYTVEELLGDWFPPEPAR